MAQETITILLIEDNPGDTRLIQEMLNAEGDERFELNHVDQLSKGIERLKEETFNVVLLDLNLPDMQGIESLTKLYEEKKDLPIIVITGLEDEYLAKMAMRQGAQDYLIKGQINNNLLVRSIHYAIERHWLMEELEKARKREQEERDRAEAVRNYQHYVAMSEGEGIDQALGEVTPLYREIVFQYVRAIRIKENRPSSRVRKFAQRLAKKNFRARDIVRLHLRVLNQFSQRAMPSEEREFSNHARLALVELMGNIMDIYMSRNVNSNE